MLVKPAWIKGIPAVELDDNTKVDKPVVLKGLPEIPRLMSRHPGADLYDLFQFVFSFCICLLFGQFGRFRAVALCEPDQRVSSNFHGP